MAFPTSPVNNQTATINGTVYYYDSSRTAWRVDAAINNPGASTGTFSNVTVSTALVIPSGNTTVRANTGVSSGAMRLNTDSGNVEVFYTNANGSAWFSAFNAFSVAKVVATSAFSYQSGAYTYQAFTSTAAVYVSANVAVDLLIVAGGGGGGSTRGGGGGAGGLYYATGVNVTPGTYIASIGAGGAGATGTGMFGTNGSNSSIFGTSMYGGGGGGSTSVAFYKGQDGGSGGGSANNTGLQGGAALLTANGYAGGWSDTTGSTNAGAGGGGGAGGIGGNGAVNTSHAGNGGIGRLISIFDKYGTDASNSTAPSTGKGYYAGGGGGGQFGATNIPGNAGVGGGTAGTTSLAGSVGVDATNCPANTGGGGGGGSAFGGNGATGGSGIVIIRYLT